MKHFKTKFLDNYILLSDKCNFIWGASRSGEIYEQNLIKDFYDKINFKNKDIIFFDIGSNTGSFIFLPLLNKFIKCYAFEPNPIAYEVLKENIELNSLNDYVKAYNLGVWSEQKILELKISKDTTDSGLSTFGDNPSRLKYDNKSGEYEIKKINCITIDSMMNDLNLKTIDIIKIDTEGSELEILKGGEKTLKKYYPPILLEFDDKNTIQFGYKRDSIIELLQSYGYNKFDLLTLSDLYATKEPQ